MKKLIFTLLVFVALFCFMPVVSSFAADITLAWDANTESNLAGYKLYYTTISPGPPYEVVKDVGNVLEYTFTGLDLKANNYWFVATAYNTEGFESGYSNEVNTVPPGSPTIRVKVVVDVEVN